MSQAPNAAAIPAPSFGDAVADAIHASTELATKIARALERCIDALSEVVDNEDAKPTDRRMAATGLARLITRDLPAMLKTLRPAEQPDPPPHDATPFAPPPTTAPTRPQRKTRKDRKQKKPRTPSARNCLNLINTAGTTQSVGAQQSGP